MAAKSKVPDIDLNPHDREEVKGILRRCIPEYEVLAFGSRVEGRAKTYSDLDLAVMTDHPLSLSEVADLKEALEESDLTIKVDIIDWASISEDFRKIIEEKNVIIQKAAGAS